MGLDDQVGCREQRMIALRRLRLEAIYRGTGDLALPERDLVDYPAACRVDQHSVALHLGEKRRIHHVPGRRNQRAMQRDDIRVRDQRADAGAKFELISRDILWPQSGIEGRDVHPKSARHRGCLMADHAHPDEPEPGPQDVPSDEGALKPATYLRRMIQMRQRFSQRKHKRDRMFRDRPCIGANRAENRDTARLRGVQIDVVHTAVLGDDLQLIGGCDHLLGDLALGDHDSADLLFACKRNDIGQFRVGRRK